MKRVTYRQARQADLRRLSSSSQRITFYTGRPGKQTYTDCDHHCSEYPDTQAGQATYVQYK